MGLFTAGRFGSIHGDKNVLDHPLFLVFAGIIGVVFGSFINMLAHRIPIMLNWAEAPAEYQTYNLFVPRSHCPHCAKTIPIQYNIPLLGYLWLRGRCHHCKHSIALRYLLVELVCLGIGLWLAWYWQGLITLILVIPLSIAVLITVIDSEYMHIPDELSYILLWSGLLVNALPDLAFVSLHNAVFGAMAGYLSLWFIHHLFKLVRGVEGMGHGDFKCFAAWGAWLGWMSLPGLMIIAAGGGLIFVLLNKLVSKTFDWKKPIAFGPWLCFAGSSLLLLSLT